MINTNNRDRVQLAGNKKCVSQKHKTSPPLLYIDKVAGWIKSLRRLGLRIYKLALKSVYRFFLSLHTHDFRTNKISVKFAKLGRFKFQIVLEGDPKFEPKLF